MPGLPTGTVTFLFTDLEGSTRLWEEHSEAMRGALARHDDVVRAAIEHHDGHVVKTTGDGFHAAFGTAAAAVDAAVAAQRALASETWVGTPPLRVRMGLHTGTGELRDGDYYGGALNRAARVMSIAHGGQVVCSQATHDLLRDDLADGMELADLGEHTLRDLARPERVFQVVAPDLERSFPELRSLSAFPSNLPRQMTSFVGRDAELAAIAEQLGATRMVTLTGVGGVGKTRLSLQVAAEVLPRFADGAWLCELAAAIDGDSLAEVVADALGVSALPGLSLQRSVVEMLKDKRILVLLDNCEHLLAPAGRLAEDLLRTCDGVRILATSREGLGVPGEQMVAVRSLGVPETGLDLAELSDNEAVTLFVERAQAARARFRMDAGNAGPIAEICRRLDGIPLAIELAAARVASMNPSDIATRIDERFRLLAGGRRVGIERHQTLRATVDWSYSLLEPAEQLVFDRLSVFSGSFDARSAEAVVSGDGVDGWDVLDLLASLVLKSMVLLEDGPDGEARYQLLETLRAYGRERLDERGETDQWRRRHAEHYAEAAETFGVQLRGPDEIGWRRQLHAALDNLRAAMSWSLDSDAGDDHALGIRIIAALGYEVTMDRGGRLSDWAERAVPLLAIVSAGQRADVLAVAAFGAQHRNELEETKRLALLAIDAGGAEESFAPILPYIALASAESMHGHFAESDAWLVLALERLGHLSLERTNALAVRALFLSIAGVPEAAAQVALEGLEAARALGNPSHLAIALSAYGIAFHTAHPVAALAAFEESLALVDEGASDVLLAQSLASTAQLRAQTGDLDGAVAPMVEAVRHCLDCGDLPGLYGVLATAAEALILLQEFELAAVCDAIPGAAGYHFFGLAALEEHERRLAPIAEHLAPETLEAVRARVASTPHTELAAEIIERLNALA